MKKRLLIFNLLSIPFVFGQCFTTGDGNEGAFHATSNTTITSGVHNYSSFIIDTGVTVTTTGTTPLEIYVSGTATIHGVLTVSGANGNDGVTYTSGGNGAIGVAGGGNGGSGTYSSSLGGLIATPGTGSGAVNNQGDGWSGGGGAGYASVGASSGGVGGFGGPTYGDVQISTMDAGSGGGGGSGGYECGAGGGGAGGGIIRLYANTLLITGTGSITANGGNGGSDGAGNCGGGGGGSGGSLLIGAFTLTNDGVISANGGVGGASAVSGSPYFGTGGNGSEGRIRIAGTVLGNGTITPVIGFQGPSSSNFVSNFSSIQGTCSGSNAGSLIVSSTGGTAPYSYSWTESGETTDNPTQLVEGMNHFQTTDDLGCIAFDSIMIDAYPVFADNQTLTICAGDSVIVGLNVYTTSGTYTDTFSSINGCDSVITTNLTVENSINTAVSVSGATLTSDQAGATYQWFNCATQAIIPNETSQSYTPTVTGNYGVLLTVNNCDATSECTLVDFSGLNELDRFVHLFPNPTNGLVTVEFDSETAVEKMVVSDNSGRILFTYSGTTTATFTIDLSNESKGVYFLSVQIGGQTQTHKITKN